MKAATRILFCLFLFAFVVSAAWAQSSSTAELHGVVKDQKGAVVGGASITIRHAARGVDLAAKSDTDGEFRFTGLRPGQYQMTVEAPGFAKFVAPDLRLTIGQRAELPVELSVATVSTEVTVNAQTQMIEPERTS